MSDDRDRSPKGVFIPMFDLPILAELPREGAMLGRIMPNAITVKRIRQILGNEMTSDQINGRLRSMEAASLVVQVEVLPTNSGSGWQITPLGETKLPTHSHEQEEAHDESVTPEA